MLGASFSLHPYRRLQLLYLSASHGCMLHYVLLLLTGYDNVQGPILSAHKKLVVEKPTEEETEHKAKGQAKKEKHLAKEKGHAKPDSVLDKTERLRLVKDHLCYFTCIYLVEMGKKEMVSSFDMPNVPTGQLPEYLRLFNYLSENDVRNE